MVPALSECQNGLLMARAPHRVRAVRANKVKHSERTPSRGNYWC